MRLAALFTGGKDSTYAIRLASSAGHDVRYLVTMFPASQESYMFHYPNLEHTRLQAHSMGIQQITGETRGVKEEELEDLRRVLSSISSEVDGLLTGAIASTYQRSRVERLAGQLGLEALSPLWGRDPLGLLRDMLHDSFEIVVTAVSAAGFDATWLGRTLDEEAVDELETLWRRFGVHPCGEGGELETFVLNCPLFRRRIVVVEAEKEWLGDSGCLRILKAELA